MAMKKSIILIIIFSLSPYTSTAQVDKDRIKASALFYICNYVDWPNNSEFKNFSIGILGENEILENELSLIAKNKLIKKKIIKINTLENITSINNFQVLYVDEKYNGSIKELFSIAQSKNILLVTNELNEPLYSMINFVFNKKTNKIGFEVNKQNLILTNFDYSDELLLYGGSVLDIKELYKTTQELLNKNTQKVAALEIENKKKESEIIEKNASIQNLQNMIFESSRTLEKLNDSTVIQQQKIAQQSKQLTNQATTYQKVQKDNIALTNLRSNLQDKIELSQDEVSTLDNEIKIREVKIKEQMANLNEKDFLIQTKDRILVLLVILGFSLLIIGILLIKAYFSKRKTSALFEKKVDERTKELKESNKKLKEEIAKKEKYSIQLVQSERNYRQIFNASTDAIFIHKVEDGSIVDVNDSMLKIYKYDRKEIPNISFADLCSGIAPYDGENGAEKIEKAINEGKQVFEWHAKKSNGELFWVEVALIATVIGDKKRILAAVRDIDEKKKIAIELDNYRKNLEQMVEERTLALNENVEELNNLNENLNTQKNKLEATIKELSATQNKLIQSEKLASLGIFTAGIAHEINNPINYISSGSQALFEIFDSVIGSVEITDPEIKQEIAEIGLIKKAIETGIEKTTAIISSLRNYAYSGKDNFMIYNSIICVQDALLLLQNNYKYRINVIKNFPEELEIECLPGKLNQLFVNLINNSIQAIKTKGDITISAAKYKNDNVVFKITDTGSGISEEQVNKIFDPFYTTKEVGEGTGLGLYIVHGIIESHNGRIEVESKINVGTTFSIYLPIIHQN